MIPLAALAEYITVTSGEYGDKWPYYADRVEIFCYKNAVLMDANGKRYALNGTAISRYKGKYPDAMSIAKPHPALSGAIMPPPRGLIKRGLQLCD